MRSIRFSSLCPLVIASFVFSSGCSTVTKVGEFSDRELMSAACPAHFSRKITGSIWTKIESKEMSGQFPASVLVDYPTNLAVEVTNLIGAPQARLTVTGEKTELRLIAENKPEHGESPRSARDMLGGLPLELAPRLFAGGVPCPSEDKNQDIRVKQTGEGGLEVLASDLRFQGSTRYVYFFKKFAGRPWVREVRLETKSNLVTITREEPSDPDGAPKRWSASSNRGEIRVRWKERTVLSGGQSSTQ